MKFELNYNQVNVITEALIRLNYESFVDDTFYTEKEVNEILIVNKELLVMFGIQ